MQKKKKKKNTKETTDGLKTTWTDFPFFYISIKQEILLNDQNHSSDPNPFPLSSSILNPYFLFWNCNLIRSTFNQNTQEKKNKK